MQHGFQTRPNFPSTKSFDMTVTRAMQRASLTKQKLPVHEGVKLICDQCKYAATTKSHFTEHKKVEHEGSHFTVTSDNCYQCDYTAIQNWLPITYKQHVHEKMKCEKCGCKTVAKKNLERYK